VQGGSTWGQRVPSRRQRVSVRTPRPSGASGHYRDTGTGFAERLSTGGKSFLEEKKY